MKFALITACFFPDTSPIKWLVDSAAHFEMQVIPYGVGLPWSSFMDIKIRKMIPFLKDLRSDGYTHVMYADGRDCLVVNNFATLIWRYGGYNAPCVISGEKNCFPRPELKDQYPGTDPYRFLNAGAYIGEIPWIIERWETLQNEYGYEDDQEALTRAYLDGRLPGLEIDSKRRIFWSNGGDLNDPPERTTCVIHFNGGYAADKPAVLEKYWNEVKKRTT